MSENGEMSQKTDEDRSIAGNMLRFLSLAARNRTKGRPAPAEPVHQPSPNEIRAEALRAWLREDAASSVFLPWLDEMIANARSMALINVSNHAEVAKWLGAEYALSTLLDELLTIQGQARRAP